MDEGARQPLQGCPAGEVVYLSAELVPYARKGQPKPEPIPLFREVESSPTRTAPIDSHRVWLRTYRVMDRLNLPPAQQERIEAAVAARGPRRTREQVEATSRAYDEMMQKHARAAVEELQSE